METRLSSAFTERGVNATHSLKAVEATTFLVEQLKGQKRRSVLAVKHLTSKLHQAQSLLHGQQLREASELVAQAIAECEAIQYNL